MNTTNRHASHIYEQSAFTFLLYKYFGYGKLSKQRVTLNNYVSIPRQYLHAHTTTSTSPPSNSNTSHSSSGSGSGSSQTMRNIIHRNQTEVKELSQQQQCNVTSQKIILCSTCFV